MMRIMNILHGLLPADKLFSVQARLKKPHQYHNSNGLNIRVLKENFKRPIGDASLVTQI